MASGYGVPVRFTKEKNVWDLFAILTVGSGGAMNFATVSTGVGPQLIGKGIANVWQNTPTFTGVIGSGSNTITSVSSFLNLYSGMALTSSFNGLTTVGTMSAATGSIILNSGFASGFTGSTGGVFVASGGQYIFQFGVNTTVGSLSQNSRLDTYNRLLNLNISYACDSGSSIGTATQVALTPTVSQYFVTQFNLRTKTLPAVATSSSTDASLVIQFGNNIGTGFQPAVLAPGMIVRVNFTMGNTTAP